MPNDEMCLFICCVRLRWCKWQPKRNLVRQNVCKQSIYHHRSLPQCLSAQFCQLNGTAECDREPTLSWSAACTIDDGCLFCAVCLPHAYKIPSMCNCHNSQPHWQRAYEKTVEIGNKYELHSCLDDKMCSTSIFIEVCSKAHKRQTFLFDNPVALFPFSLSLGFFFVESI